MTFFKVIFIESFNLLKVISYLIFLLALIYKRSQIVTYFIVSLSMRKVELMYTIK